MERGPGLPQEATPPPPKKMARSPETAEGSPPVSNKQHCRVPLKARHLDYKPGTVLPGYSRNEDTHTHSLAQHCKSTILQIFLIIIIKKRSSPYGSEVMNPTSIHRTPVQSLATQWVKDPALP